MTAVDIEADVVIVGAGISGAAAAYSAAQTGAKVVVVEQFEIGHDRGSSHGDSRVFRLSYPDPKYVEMAQESLIAWRELEKDLGRRILLTTGGVDSGPTIEQNAQALAKCGATFERLTGSSLMDRFSGLNIDPDMPLLVQPDAGVLLAEDAWSGFIDGARRNGAEILQNTSVVGLSERAGRAVVSTSAGDIGARVAIVTAGAWAPFLLKDIGVNLDVVTTRETIAYFDVDASELPVLVDWTATPFYALESPKYGLKTGLHKSGPVTNPVNPGEVNEAAVDLLSEIVPRRFKGAPAKPTHAETCIYTNTSDESFIIERHGPFVIGSACSGHAFKFAPVTGKRLAALALRQAA